MATKAKAGVRLSGRFSPGTKVDLYQRVGVMFDRAHVGTALATTTVDKLGEAAFDGLDLEPGTQLWVAGRDENDVWRGVQVTAKLREGDGTAMSPADVRARLKQTQPPSTAVQPSTTTGARSTASARVVGGNGQPFAHPKVGVPTPAGEREKNPAPYPRIEDVKEGTVLRSHTVTGEAHPVDLDVPDGHLRQDQVPKGTFQASDTPLGEATVLPEQPGDPASARVEGDNNERAAAQKAAPQPRKRAAKKPAKRKASTTAKKPAAKKAAANPAATRTTARKASPKKS